MRSDSVAPTLKLDRQALPSRRSVSIGMLVLDFVRRTDANAPALELPPFHTGHLGFVGGTEVYFGLPHAKRPEVLVTPLHTGQRDLAMLLRDAPMLARPTGYADLLGLKLTYGVERPSIRVTSLTAGSCFARVLRIVVGVRCHCVVLPVDRRAGDE